MTRTEAIHFYTVKESRATSRDSKLAYYNLVRWFEENTYTKAIELVELNATDLFSSKRKAIYKKALRELGI